MNSAEKKMTSLLKDLKENHHVIAIKTEFEAEGASVEEIKRLKELISNTDLDLTIKIGGCEAVTDAQEAKNIGISSLVAPMIETPYAMKKYVKTILSIFSEEERKNKNFLINIETITGYNNLNDILYDEEFKILDGIVLGRGDMSRSIGLTRDDVNSNQVLNIADSISKKIKDINKLFFVGGGISAASATFLKQLPYLSGFQTRKVVFDSKALTNKDTVEGILKAIEFEVLWLENKKEYSCYTKRDENRVQMLLKSNNLIKTNSIFK